MKQQCVIILHVMFCRASDIFKLIDIAVSHRSAAIKHADLRPVIKPHTKLLLRIILVHCASERYS